MSAVDDNDINDNNTENVKGIQHNTKNGNGDDDNKVNTDSNIAQLWGQWL